MKFTVDINYSYRESESASVELEADSADDITEEAVIAALEDRMGRRFSEDEEVDVHWAVDDQVFGHPQPATPSDCPTASEVVNGYDLDTLARTLYGVRASLGQKSGSYTDEEWEAIKMGFPTSYEALLKEARRIAEDGE